VKNNKFYDVKTVHRYNVDIFDIDIDSSFGLCSGWSGRSCEWRSGTSCSACWETSSAPWASCPGAGPFRCFERTELESFSTGRKMPTARGDLASEKRRLFEFWRTQAQRTRYARAYYEDFYYSAQH